MTPVRIKIYDAPEINVKEILRYAGARGEMPELKPLISECLAEAKDKLTYKVCYRQLSVIDNGDFLDLSFATTASNDLRKNLRGCESVVLFGATIGLGIDRLIAKYSSVSPVKALLFQAICAERIESLCDTFNSEIKAEHMAVGKATRPRFSPGYGDFPIEMQRKIFDALDCAKNIGLTLNGSMLMSPSKSVTAIIGIGEIECKTPASGCATCSADCDYRRK